MAAVLVLAPAGCSLGGDEEPKPATGAPREVAALVAQLELATRQSDFAGICDDILTKAARERAGGEDCERLLRSAAAGVERPVIEIRQIEVEGRRASVRVRTSARGQSRVTDTLTLVNEESEWRVEALGD